MKKLGFGMMRLPLLTAGDDGAVDLAQTRKMADLFLERGYTYFDTAWMYHNFRSEEAAGEILRGRPRESYTLATKLHAGFVNSLADRDRIFGEQLRKTGADWFDFYLLHGIQGNTYEKYERFGCFDWILEKKAKGLIRSAGFSFHADAELLDRILTDYPEMEFVQLQLNYLDWENPAVGSKECYEVARRHGKPVTVMEPVKGGTLANLPAPAAEILREARPDLTPAAWALRFAAGLEGVRTVLSGMSSLAQMEENTAALETSEPLGERELAAIRKVTALLRAGAAIPCTGCSYCTTGCPKKIAIPGYFALYNADLLEFTKGGWHPQMTYYDNLLRKNGGPADCIGCGQCESVCPQHLGIIEGLKKVAAYFG